MSIVIALAIAIATALGHGGTPSQVLYAPDASNGTHSGPAVIVEYVGPDLAEDEPGYVIAWLDGTVDEGP